jgi:ribosomal protein L30
MPKKAAGSKTTAKKKTARKSAAQAAAKKSAAQTAAKKPATKTAVKKPAAKTAVKKPAAQAAATPPAMTGRLRVRQVRSGIGHAETYRRTLRALGLKHHQDETTVADNPSARGMLDKVRHLVRVTPEEA